MAVRLYRQWQRRAARASRLAALAATAWTVAAAIAAAQPSFRIVEVAPASSTGSRGAQIDPTGTYVTGIAYESLPAVPPAWPTTEARVFLWSGETPAQIVVERAMYSTAGGVAFAAGTNTLATKLQWRGRRSD